MAVIEKITSTLFKCIWQHLNCLVLIVNLIGKQMIL